MKMFKAFWAVFDAAWSLQKGLAVPCKGTLLNEFLIPVWLFLLFWISAMLPCSSYFIFVLNALAGHSKSVPSFIDMQDSDEKAWGWLSSCCQFDGRTSFHLPLAHSTVKMKISKSTSTLENVACIQFPFL